jgi:hypothetical protein
MSSAMLNVHCTAPHIRFREICKYKKYANFDANNYLQNIHMFLREHYLKTKISDEKSKISKFAFRKVTLDWKNDIDKTALIKMAKLYHVIHIVFFLSYFIFL